MKKRPLKIEDKKSRMNARLALVVMFALGMTAVAVSEWFYSDIQRRPLKLWGSDAASAIMKTPIVTAIRLGPPGTVTPDGRVETMSFKAARVGVLDRRDCGRAPGFSHLRASLVHDDTFQWDAPKSDCESQWEYALEFGLDAGAWTLLFAPNCNRVMLGQTGAEATLQSSAGFVKFFHDVLGD
jgi:hypothetical protein